MSEQTTTAPTIIDIFRRNMAPTVAMLRNIIMQCPDEAWADGHPAVWQQLYHTIFWFNAWARDWATPFKRPTFHSDDVLNMVKGATPVLTREQLVEYLRQAEADCYVFLDHLTPESLIVEVEAFGVRWTPADRILGQLRHIQHHVGGMHATIRRVTDSAPKWVGFNEG